MDALRLGDADRAAGRGCLGEQYALGRLTREELDERSDAVWSAKTRGDLAPLFVDLPVRRRRDRGAARPRPGSPHPAFPLRLLGPVLVGLVLLTMLTHVPFLLIGLVAWFVLSRRHGIGRPPWAGHGHPYGRSVTRT